MYAHIRMRSNLARNKLVLYSRVRKVVKTPFKTLKPQKATKINIKINEHSEKLKLRRIKTEV